MCGIVERFRVPLQVTVASGYSEFTESTYFGLPAYFSMSRRAVMPYLVASLTGDLSTYPTAMQVKLKINRQV